MSQAAEMQAETPFLIGSNGVRLLADPASWQRRFADIPAIAIADGIEPEFRTRLVERAARASFVRDDVLHVGTRSLESPQLVGKALSLVLHSPDLLRWLEQATGVGPLDDVAGSLFETRAASDQALDWHDDRNDPARRLAIVINLSDQGYSGGQFQLRRKGESTPLLCHDHLQPGSILIFAVDPGLEHRVTPVDQGGPRRVFSGWFTAGVRQEPGGLRSTVNSLGGQSFDH